MNTTSTSLLLTNPDPTETQENGDSQAPADGSPIHPNKSERPKKTAQHAPQTTEQLPVPCEPARHPDELTLSEGSCSMYLYASTLKALNVSGSPEGFLHYRKRFLQGCGSPTDPIEVMLIESLMLAHHSAGRLLVLSASADQWDAVTAYSMAGTKLMAELRRGALALQEYRDAQAAQLKRAIGGQESGKAAPSSVQQEVQARQKVKASQPKANTGGANGATTGKCCPSKLITIKGACNGDSNPWKQKRFDFPISDESRLVAGIGV